MLGCQGVSGWRMARAQAQLKARLPARRLPHMPTPHTNPAHLAVRNRVQLQCRKLGAHLLPDRGPEQNVWLCGIMCSCGQIGLACGSTASSAPSAGATNARLGIEIKGSGWVAGPTSASRPLAFLQYGQPLQENTNTGFSAISLSILALMAAASYSPPCHGCYRVWVWKRPRVCQCSPSPGPTSHPPAVS